MPRDTKAYAYEVKWDGYRALAAFDGRALCLTSRNANDLSPRFTEVQQLEASEQRRTQLAEQLAEPLARGLSVPDAAAAIGADRREADLLIHASNLKRNRGKAWAERLHAARKKGEQVLERWQKQAAKPVLAALERRDGNLRDLCARAGIANSRIIKLRAAECLPTRDMVARLSRVFPELASLLKDA